MKARIDNRIEEVEIIDANYNDYAVEVKTIGGKFDGVYAIVEKQDLIKEKKTKRFLVQMQDFNYDTKTYYYKSFGYCETIEEARKLKSKAPSICNTRILDRWTKEYII